nr:restriction endonuclease subunit S [uncultured Vibrio sp.]
MSQLPKGWVSTKFTDYLDVNGGSQPPKKDFLFEETDGYIRLLQIRDFGKKPLPTYVPFTSKLRLCCEEDILIGRYGASLGRICTGMEGCYNVALAKVAIPDLMDNRFVKYYLESELFQQPLRLLSRSAQNGFNKKDLGEFDFPLAPLPEQKRIVEKLDEVLAQVDTIKARLDGIPELLKRFRQSVLASAVSGKLTEEWRGKHYITVELSKVSRAYAEGWESEKQREFSLKEKYPKTDSWKQRLPEPYLPTDEDGVVVGPLPQSWLLVSVDQLTKFVKDGPHYSPKYSDDGIEFISGRNITIGGIDFSTSKYITKELHEELSLRCKPVYNDVLLTKGGTTGISCVNKYKHEFNVWVHVAVLRVTSEEVILPDYLSMFFNSPVGHFQSQKYTHGVANRDLGLKRMIKICLGLPSIEEQKEIVRLVDQYFAFADTIEAQVKKAQARVDNLTQSILAKAFRGELVPQNDDDEPAEILLERIAQARKEAEALAKAAKKAAKKKA